MPTQKLANLFVALFLFMLAWSLGLADPLMDWVNPKSDMVHYFVSKGILTLVFSLVLWRFHALAAIGFRPGMGLSSYVVGLPLLALGLFSYLDPSKPDLTAVDLAGWTVVVLFVAFTEETLFRGVLWEALGGPRIWRRAITTSAMFGLAHFVPAGLGDFGWAIAAVYGLSAFGFGMVFAAMREQAGTIWSVIVVHAVFDFVAISAAGSVSSLLEPGFETYMRFLSAAVVFTAWGSGAIYLMSRRAAREGV